MDRPTDDRIIAFPGTEFAAAMQLRAELLLTETPVWRRLLVPLTCDFWGLHVALQDVFGWPDRHLHRFTVDDPRTGQRLRFGIPDASGFHGVHEVLPGWRHQAAPYLGVDGRAILYSYDPARGWQHDVVLEEIHEAARTPLPRCLDGAGWPPADGGDGGQGGCQNGDPDADDEAFDAAAVVFDDPRRRWLRSFGHE